MTVLSVNVNKIALLRNSRGRYYPNVVDFVSTCLDLGVKGITVHPRPDERHVTRKDVFDLSALLKEVSDVEFNIEGFPSSAFLELVHEVAPDQCTLVPDKPLEQNEYLLQLVCLNGVYIRLYFLRPKHPTYVGHPLGKLYWDVYDLLFQHLRNRN